MSETGVTFSQFLNAGSTSLTGRALGAVDVLGYMMNGVELQFTIEPHARQRYRNIRPVQWLGPDVIWIKTGEPFSNTWLRLQSGRGDQWDNPEPQNVVTRPNAVAYYDSPGPNLMNYVRDRPSMVYVVQNFTGWVVGESIATGGQLTNLCPVAAWNSVMYLIDANWSTPNSTPGWQRTTLCQSSLGWSDVMARPPF